MQFYQFVQDRGAAALQGLLVANVRSGRGETLARRRRLVKVIQMMVTLDHMPFKRKPEGRDFGALTKRFTMAGGSEIDARAFCDHVRHGKTWVGGVYEESDSGWGSFVGQQVFGMDFDNDTECGKNADGSMRKRPLRPGEAGYLDPLDALRRCLSLDLVPLCLYFTLSATLDPLNYRYRLVFDMGEPVRSQGEAEGVLGTLLEMFPEADQKCRNPNRLFCGSNGEVIETWEALA